MSFNLARCCIWFLLFQDCLKLYSAREEVVLESSITFVHSRNSLVKLFNSQRSVLQPVGAPFVHNITWNEKRESLVEFPTTTVVAACKDRLPQLKQVFNSWLSLHGIFQIVLVDWSSSESLHSFVVKTLQQTLSHVQVVIVRVENASNWNLAQAYNLGISFAGADWILKLDCDTWIDRLFLVKHPMRSHSFYSASIASEKSLHGVFYMPKQVFYQIGGFDERIQSYGWEDDSLLERAKSYLYLERIQPGTIVHIPHEEILRLKYQSCLLETDCLPELEVQYNRILFSKFLPTWNGIDSLQSEYLLLEHQVSNYTSLIRLRRQKPVSMPSLSSFFFDLAKTKAIRIILEAQYHFPRKSLKSWPLFILERVIRQLIRNIPFLLITTYERASLRFVENLFTKEQNLRLIIFIANTSYQFAQSLQNDFPVLHWNDTEVTRLFQNPKSSFCFPYQVVSKRTFYELSQPEWMLFYYQRHHLILSP
ncbi:hypothetical protein GpartN1_g2287.t1 [Galdieria partita]|uniref:Glycosyltransferase 2-like domain-containing protein n=1 Tax=Galdieria partita TaxID=83374 RepID=A0A9C7UPE7_9RHOD|nr:hypothetical protein GpartN1_g2287.t1 [Galdieria partita]